MLGGPQSDRSRMFEGSAGRDDILAPERGGFEGETTKLRRENGILKDQLQRSLKELKGYQQKYPSAYVNIQHKEGDELPPWASSPDIMVPLFEAYDTRAKELEGIVHHQSEQLKAQNANISNIVAENEELRDAQMAHLRSQAGTHTDAFLQPSGPVHAEVLAEMNERIDILMAENALMTEQKVILSVEMDNQQADLLRRGREVEALSEKLAQCSQELKNCAAQGVQTEQERDEAAQQAVSLSDALGRMDAEMQAVREQLLMWQQKAADTDTTVSELKKSLKAATAEAEESATGCVRRAKVAEERVKQVNSQLQRKAAELETAQEVIRKLRREYQSTRQDAEGMLQVMSGLERQLTEYSTREAEVERSSRESKERVEQSLVERDQAVAREDQARREIEKLLEDRKKTHERRQADVDGAAEQARTKALELVRRCEQELRATVETTVKSQAEADKSIRDGKSATDSMRRLAHVHSDETRALEGTIRELRELLTAALLAKDEEASKKIDILEMNKELRQVVEKLRLDTDALQGQINASERTRLSETSTLKTLVREQSKELQEKSRALSHKSKELEGLQEDTENKLAAAAARLEEETSTLSRRCTEAEQAAKEAEAAAQLDEERMQALVDQLRQKSQRLTTQLEGSLRAEIESGRRVSSKNRELEATVHLLGEEKGMLVLVVEEARNSISELQEDLISARDTILDLTESLSESHTAREEASQRAANVLEALESTRTKASRKGKRGGGEPQESHSSLPEE